VAFNGGVRVRLASALIDGLITPMLGNDDGSFSALATTDTMHALIAAGASAIAASLPAESGPRVAQPQLIAPLAPGKIVAIGLNYLDHIRETGLDAPTRPLVFAKLPSSVVGPGAAIEIDPLITNRVDWEGELAVVIGRRLRHTSAEDALAAVFGYTICNDVSARDVQFEDSQWVRGKSLDTFCPLGPVIVTADELPDPHALVLQTRVNGELVQNSPTADMIFGVAELLSFCSHSFTLEPGDVLLTGTPWGCGDFMSPPRSLAPGDIVDISIEGIGVLSNPVRMISREHRGQAPIAA
jgi:2-keto-4-pentenoate hydratase/2-oxohepta-3-ene-1,7-dioic acid hydratase in catechol pathway